MIDRSTPPAIVVQAQAPLAELVADIQTTYRQFQASVRTSVESARRMGELLNRAKAAVGHGQWGDWLATHFEFNARTAQRWMLLARRWPEIEVKNDTVSFLTTQKALSLLADSSESNAPDEEQADERSQLAGNESMGETDAGPVSLQIAGNLDGESSDEQILIDGIEPKSRTGAMADGRQQQREQQPSQPQQGKGATGEGEESLIIDGDRLDEGLDAPADEDEGEDYHPIFDSFNDLQNGIASLDKMLLEADPERTEDLRDELDNLADIMMRMRSELPSWQAWVMTRNAD